MNLDEQKRERVWEGGIFTSLGMGKRLRMLEPFFEIKNTDHQPPTGNDSNFTRSRLLYSGGGGCGGGCGGGGCGGGGIRPRKDWPAPTPVTEKMATSC